MRLARRTLIASTLALPAVARAQAAWPTRTIRLVVPFPPAGTTDIVARIIAEPLGRALGQTVVIENRGGAGGNLGADLVAKADPDGYTLLMTTIGTGAINYALYPQLPWKPSDLAAVSLITTVPNVIFVANSTPAKTLQELVALAKSKPGELSIGSSGSGTSLHMTGELLKLVTGIDMIHVPFRGAGPMLTEVIAGRVNAAVDNLPSALGHIKDGRLRALAVTEPKRSPALPDVPTTAEAGFPQVEATAWFGIQAPARTPRAVIDRIAAAGNQIVHDPAIAAKIREQGGEPVGGTAESFEKFIAAEIAKWADVVKRSGAKVE